MNFRSCLSAPALILASLLSVGSSALAAGPVVNAHPAQRILATRIDNAQVVALPHSTHGLTTLATDNGKVAANTQLKSMFLVLSSTDEQEYALAGLLDSQQDKTSPNFHKWITPEAFGQSFGVAQPDIARLTAWLGDQGLTVDSVSKSARIIAFSGSADAVSAAFHTEIHSYTLNGVNSIANSRDLSIPAALASVVRTVAGLATFPVQSHMVGARTEVLGKNNQFVAAIPGTTSPDYTSTASGSHSVGATDLATIYNATALQASGITGQGVNIGVIGRTDISLADIQIYRTFFNLPVNDPAFVLVGTDPGTIADDGESDLDVELAGALAYNAKVTFARSGQALGGGGIDAAALYFVEQNNVDIISLSYGQCESSLAGNNGFFNALWQQAATQGQTVFVSSGDSGADTCASSAAAYGPVYAVNGLGSTPYNVSVGGTQFNEGSAYTTLGAAPPYWTITSTGVNAPPFSTALQYIPEQPWDEGGAGNGLLGGLGAAGSGVSYYYARPSFQTGPGVPAADPITVPTTIVAGPHRLMPDVAFIAAAGHDATIYCSEGNCQLTAAGAVQSRGLVGGTSVATPAMASVQALINQKNGGRQGNANYYYYKLAAAQSTTACASNLSNATPSTAPASTCNFNDTVSGNNNIYANSTKSATIGFTAASGYDVATGLGSPNIANVVNNWSSVTFTATTTTLSISPSTATVHGTSLVGAVTVAPTSGTGVPTGTVTFTATNAANLFTYPLTAGKLNAQLAGLPGGTYNVVAHYSGDITYGASASMPVSVTVTPETSSVASASYLLTSAGALSSTSTFTYGQDVYIDTQVSNPANSASSNPSGSITYTLTPATGTPLALQSKLDTYSDAYIDAGNGFPQFDIASTTGPLPVGTYTVTTAYGGDSSYSPSTATPVVVVVGQAAGTVSLSSSSLYIASAGSVALTGSVSYVSGFAPPTGTLTFLDGTTQIGTATLLSNGAAVLTTSALVSPGAHSVTVMYSGDGNYKATTSAAVTVNVSALLPTTITATPTTTAFTTGNTIIFSGQVLPVGATGTVALFDNGVRLANTTLTAATGIALDSDANLKSGPHSVTMVYSGDTTYDGSTSAPYTFTVTQRAPSINLTAQLSNTYSKTVALQVDFTSLSKTTSPQITGSVQFFDGTTSLGTAPLLYLSSAVTANLPAATLTGGTHTITATYLGDANYAAVSSNSVSIAIAQAPSVTAASSTTTSVVLGVPFTVTANVTSPYTGLTNQTGLVTFSIGTRTLGTAPVAGGVATLTTATVTVSGANAITATYSGDANYLPSASTTSVSVTGVPAGFTLAVTPSVITVARGTTGTVTGTITAFNNYSGSIAVSCVGINVYTTCTASPTPIAIAGVNGTSTFTVSISPSLTGSYSLLWLPALLLGGLLMFRRNQVGKLGYNVKMLMILAFMAAAALTTSGCGGNSYTGAIAGTYNFTVQAVGTPTTGTLSPAVTQTATVSLTVK